MSHPEDTAAALPCGRRRALGALALLGLGAASWPASTRAAERPRPLLHPTRPVRIVVPYAVGIGPDVVARGLAAQLQARWGHAVIVDNKPGASGIVAFSELRRVPADGHTLFLADTATLAVNPLLHATLPYDPWRDIAPLTLLFRATFLLWTAGDHRFRDLGALLAAARREPGRVSYASLGHGHASHVAIETFARAAGLQLLHVPFKDAGALMTAVAVGQVDFTAIGANSVAGLVAQGRLRALAVAAAQRLADLPAVPTLAEAGGPAVEMHPWAALVAPAGTPEPVIASLHADLTTAMAQPALQAQATRAGFELTPSSPQAVRDRQQADTALVTPLVAEGRVAAL